MPWAEFEPAILAVVRRTTGQVRSGHIITDIRSVGQSVLASSP